MTEPAKKEGPKTPRRGGRPSKTQAGDIEEKIFATAAALFLRDGYGAVSIEQIAREARISKRTFYARHEDKADLFRAVVRRIIEKMAPPSTSIDHLFDGPSTEEVLRRIAPIILRASLTQDGLALHRIVMAEATRFPELAFIMNEQGMRQEAIHRIADLLQRDKKTTVDPIFAAEQFLLMITSAPQRRALGLGTPMTASQLTDWADDTVTLFLTGYRVKA